MDQCLFCNIIAGKLPGYKVYEDSNFLAILDKNPANPGHIVLMPKLHAMSIMEMSETDISKFFILARALSLAVLEFGAEGVNFLYSMGETAGQRAPHVLLHIIPRHKGDKFHFNVWEPKQFSDEEFKIQQQKLSALVYKGAKVLQQAAPQQNLPQTQPSVVVQEPRNEQKTPEKKIYNIEPYRGGYWG